MLCRGLPCWHRGPGATRPAGRAARPVRAARPAPQPLKPKPPATLDLAVLPEHDLADEATYRRLGFYDLELPGRSAEAVEFEQCRFRNADLSGTQLRHAGFSDCLIESSNLANLNAQRSSLRRVRLTVLRMTGLHWVDGALRDVAVCDCKADLAVFRFTTFRNVIFDRCNLTRVDFQNADLTGVRFTGCDLTGAQFSHATLEGTRFTDCELAGVGGVTSFAGAIVAGGDLITLSHTLATALGIRIEGFGGDPDTTG
ncbi:MAG: pentapeptide repeat-containing protein [Micromonosporaceae bacterium]|nr:pentapeptide repeat-containing protein [Micromonosporaceae bacterium]